MSENICGCGRVDEGDFHSLDCPHHPFAIFPSWAVALEADAKRAAIAAITEEKP